MKDAYDMKGREAALEVYKAVLAENPGLGEELAFLAADFAHPEALILLFEAGVSPTATGDKGFTLLHYLAKKKESYSKIKPEGAIKATTELLLDNKVSALRKDEWLNITCYLYAAQNGMWEMIEVMAARGTKLNMTDRKGNTGIHIACEHVRNRLNSLEYRKRDLDRAMKEYEEIRDRLKDQNKTEEQIVQYAERNMFITVSYAQQEYDKAVAEIEGYFLTVKAFAEGGVDINEKNTEGKSALDIAIHSNAKKIAAYLSGSLTDDADESVLTIGGMTLHQAAEKGDVEAIKAIVATGADLNGLKDGDKSKFGGCTALAIAYAHMKADSAEALLSCGADPSYKDGNGRAAISYLAADLSSALSNKVYEEKRIQRMFKDLFNAGMNINLSVNDDGDTLLILACRAVWGAAHGKKELKKDILDAVLRHDPDVNLPNRFGETALMNASAKNFEIMENIQIDLLERGADVTFADKKGDTALHYAARNFDKKGAKSLCEMLLEFGADAKAVNNAKQTALDIATEKDNEPLVKLLLGKM
ncbi:MAG: ankyrin repeat domain-containing protein [Methanomassiliicoccaceae archaeon]|nr:ankyrin repeat domain-containing protein [Methanomassiliicoccaceae archaeon]